MTPALRDETLKLLAQFQGILKSEFEGSLGYPTWVDRLMVDIGRVMDALRVAKVEQA